MDILWWKSPKMLLFICWWNLMWLFWLIPLKTFHKSPLHCFSILNFRKIYQLFSVMSCKWMKTVSPLSVFNKWMSILMVLIGLSVHCSHYFLTKFENLNLGKTKSFCNETEIQPKGCFSFRSHFDSDGFHLILIPMHSLDLIWILWLFLLYLVKVWITDGGSIPSSIHWCQSWEGQS